MNNITRTGKYFEVGKEFTDKNGKKFSVTEADADAGIAEFTPQSLNLEHMPTIFDGLLGTVNKLWRSGKDILAEYSIPKWLHEATKGEPIKVSSEWSIAEKKPGAAALVLSPAVSDAVMMSAATEFAARHDTPQGQNAMQGLHDYAAAAGAVCNAPNARMSSKHESKAIQAVHDMTTEHGAKCASGPRSSYFAAGEIAAIDNESAAPGEITQTVPKGKPMSKFAWLTAMFTKAGVEPPTTEQLAELSAPDPASATKIADLEAQITALKTDSTVSFAAMVDDRAAAFADGVIQAKKALPAERSSIIVAFTQAAKDDAAHPATVQFSKIGADGKAAVVTGSRVNAIEALYEARPAHTLTREMLKEAMESGDLVQFINRQSAPDAEAEKPMDEKRYKALMSATPFGTAVLKEAKS